MKNLFSCYLIFGLISLGYYLVVMKKMLLTLQVLKAWNILLYTLSIKGKKYTVPCVIENDTVIKFLDVEFNELYQNEIALLPDLAILVTIVNTLNFTVISKNC